ncbi:MAG: WD40 repeat domain-containing protein, partial [Spirochaetia bacterium]
MRGKLLAALVAAAAAAVTPLSAQTQTPRIEVELGHTEPVQAVIPSSNGAFLVSAGADRRIKLWELSGFREIRSFDYHKSTILSIALSPDGRMLASADADRKLFLLRDYARDPALRLATNAQVKALSFTNDGHLLVALDAEGIVTWFDTTTGTPARSVKLSMGSDAQAFSLSRDGSTALIGHASGSLQVYQLGPAVRGSSVSVKAGKILGVCLSPDGALGAYGDQDGNVGVFSLGQQPRLRVSLKSRGGGAACGLAFSDDASLFATTAWDKTIQVWDLTTQRRLWTDTYDTIPYCPAFSADGKQLYCGTANLYTREDSAPGLLFTGFRNEILCYDVASKTIVRKFSGQNFPPVCARFFSDSRRIAITGSDLTVKIWDLSRGEIVKVMSGHTDEIRSLVIYPDDSAIATCSWDGTVRIWSCATGKQIRELETGKAMMNELALAPDGSLLVAGDAKGRIRVWNAKTGDLRQEIQAHGSFIYSICFSPDGTSFASACQDATVKVWEASSGELLRSIDTGGMGARKVRISGDSTTLYVACEEKALHAYDMRTGNEKWLSTEVGDGVNGLMETRDGKTVLVADGAGLVTRIDALNGRKLGDVADFQSTVFSIEPDRTGQFAVTAGRDATFRIIDLRSLSLLVSGMSSKDGEDSLLWTPDGYFDGTDWAMRNLVYVVDGMKTYSIDRFYERFHRPDIVIARLKGLDTGSMGQENLTRGFAVPPDIAISLKTKAGRFLPMLAAFTPASDWLVEDGYLTVRVSARDTGGGIDGIRLYVSGKAVGLELGGLAPTAGESVTREFNVPLASGENLLRAVGFSRDRTESAPVEVKVTYDPHSSTRPALYILAAGADTYR